MLNRATDGEWETLGRSDPYFAVLTAEKYHKENLTEAGKAEFFQSGRVQIEETLAIIHKHIDLNFEVVDALDFGCGVGRFLVPLSEMSKSVTGVDVSDSMLAEAKRNCDARSISNVSLVKSDDRLSALEGSFNFIHTHIVMQHIPVRRGVALFKGLLARLQPGGVGVFHFTYGKKHLTGKASGLARYVPYARNIKNILKGRSFFHPFMEMNDYNLNELFQILQLSGIEDVHAEYTDHAGHLGVVLYFRKPLSDYHVFELLGLDPAAIESTFNET